MGGAQTARRYVFPDPDDSVASLARRLLPDDPDAETTLLSWNLHLAVRRSPAGTPTGLLCTDIVYLEPP